MDFQRPLTAEEGLSLREGFRSNTEMQTQVSRQIEAQRNALGDTAEGEARLTQLEAEADNLLTRHIATRAQIGRALNGLRITAAESNDPLLWMTKAKKALGTEPLTDVMRNTITGILDAGDKPGLVGYVPNLGDDWQIRA